MAKKILFTPIGGTDPIKNYRDGSMLHICRVYKPDVVYVYLSHEMMEMHRNDNRYVYSLEKLGELLNHSFECKIIERDELTEVQQYDVFYHDFRQIIKDIEKEMDDDDELIINMASGTPAMKSALLVMATLAEYRFLPIQVSTPKKGLNSEASEREGYEVELQWELNEDNSEGYENRCTEVRCVNLMRLLKMDMIKKHIMAYDYTAAKTVANEIKDELPEAAYQLIGIASERIKLNRSKISVLMRGKDYDIFPIKDGKYQKVFEYVLGLGIKLKREEYADFIRGITPLVVDLLESILERNCGIKLADYCKSDFRDGHKIWDKNKLKKSGLLEILDMNYGGAGCFKGRDVYSTHIAALIKGKSDDLNLKQKLDEIAEVEKKVRNVAAHQIVSVTDEWFKKETGKSANEIFTLLKQLTVSAGVPVKNDYWKSYDMMNAMILQAIDG